MSLYFETIQLRDGELLNLAFHQQRFQHTRNSEMRLRQHPLLEEVIDVPDGLHRGIFKCRVIYGKEVERIEYEAYRRKIIRSLKLVYPEKISYRFKYQDRTMLEELYSQRENCDDILIVRDGIITDSFFANVVFLEDKQWVTPDCPLLPGTMRASLISAGRIVEKQITPDDLKKFKKARLINAFNSLPDGVDIPMASIHP